MSISVQTYRKYAAKIQNETLIILKNNITLKVHTRDKVVHRFGNLDMEIKSHRILIYSNEDEKLFFEILMESIQDYNFIKRGFFSS